MKRIVLAGGTGFLGRALAKHLQGSGYAVSILSRTPRSTHEPGIREIAWDARTLGDSFGLPAARWMLEIGAFLLRTETELIIKSRRVVPKRLTESGFTFDFPTLRSALENLNAE
jgi:NAD dependent epimerase/dehydratase family enzyme